MHVIFWIWEKRLLLHFIEMVLANQIDDSVFILFILLSFDFSIEPSLDICFKQLHYILISLLFLIGPLAFKSLFDVMLKQV